MRETMTEQQRREAAASSFVAKFRSFHDQLTPDEHAVLALTLQSIAAQTDDAADVSGHLEKLQQGLCLANVVMADTFVRAVTLGYLGVSGEWTGQGCELSVGRT